MSRLFVSHVRFVLGQLTQCLDVRRIDSERARLARPARPRPIKSATEGSGTTPASLLDPLREPVGEPTLVARTPKDSPLKRAIVNVSDTCVSVKVICWRSSGQAGQQTLVRDVSEESSEIAGRVSRFNFECDYEIAGVDGIIDRDRNRWRTACEFARRRLNGCGA